MLNTPKRKYTASKRKLFPHVPKPVSLSGIDDADRMLLSRVGQGSMSEGVRTLCQWRREFEKANEVGGELPPSPLLSADAPLPTAGEAFKEALRDMAKGNTYPIETLWDKIESD